MRLVRSSMREGFVGTARQLGIFSEVNPLMAATHLHESTVRTINTRRAIKRMLCFRLDDLKVGGY